MDYYLESDVEVDYYKAEFWCADYDTHYGEGGLVISYTCAPIRLNEEPLATATLTVTDCILTSEGCSAGYYE